MAICKFHFGNEQIVRLNLLLKLVVVCNIKKNHVYHMSVLIVVNVFVTLFLSMFVI